MDFTELRATFDPNTVQEILHVTIENANNFFRTLNKAYMDKNYKNMYDSCHNIIAMGFIGHHPVFDVCKNINNILRNNKEKVCENDALMIEKLTKNMIMHQHDFIEQIKHEIQRNKPIKK